MPPIKETEKGSTQDIGGTQGEDRALEARRLRGPWRRQSTMSKERCCRICVAVFSLGKSWEPKFEELICSGYLMSIHSLSSRQLKEWGRACGAQGVTALAVSQHPRSWGREAFNISTSAHPPSAKCRQIPSWSPPPSLLTSPCGIAQNQRWCMTLRSE